MSHATCRQQAQRSWRGRARITRTNLPVHVDGLGLEARRPCACHRAWPASVYSSINGVLGHLFCFSSSLFHQSISITRPSRKRIQHEMEGSKRNLEEKERTGYCTNGTERIRTTICYGHALACLPGGACTRDALRWIDDRRCGFHEHLGRSSQIMNDIAWPSPEFLQADSMLPCDMMQRLLVNAS